MQRLITVSLKKFGEFMRVPFDVHLARSFEIPAAKQSQLCRPASFAAFGALISEQDDPF